MSLGSLPIPLIAATVCAVWASAIPAADTFTNPTAGFEVTKPKDWRFTTAAEHQENLKSVKLTDQELQAAMLKYATVPMVAMTKHAEPFDDVNPSFKVNIKPMGQLKGKSAVEILNVVLPQLQRMFKDFQLTQPAIEKSISGLKAAYARIDYSLEAPDGRAFPITSDLWIVPRGDYFFMMGAGTRKDEKTGSRKEIQAILDTVKIEH